MRVMVEEENVIRHYRIVSEGGGGHTKGDGTADVHFKNGKFVGCKFDVPSKTRCGYSLVDWSFLKSLAEKVLELAEREGNT